MMSDCDKCWMTPCCCGHDYKDYSKEKMAEIIAEILQYRSKSDARDILEHSKSIVTKKSHWKHK